MEKLTEVNAKNPCPHCGKPDWCYSLPNGATVCNRGNIASGWVDSGKKDKQGAAILFPESWQGKAPEPKVIKKREWVYVSRLEPHPDLVKVIRHDLDNGKKKVFQNFWNGSEWLKSRPKSLEREEIPIYRYLSIQSAIQRGETIFIVEGEPCADILWSLGLAATCNIQGAKSFSLSDAADVVGAKKIVLCPDRDRPGVELMEKWEKALKGLEVEYLYAFPEKDWGRLPASDGLDVADWIKEAGVTKEMILAAVGVVPPGIGETAKVETSTPLKPARPETKRVYGGTKPLQTAELIDFVESEIAPRLEFDDLRSDILLDGERMTMGTDCKVWFYRTFGEVAGKDDIYDTIVNFAKDNAFNPVARYLEQTREQPRRVRIDNLATRYFGRSEKIFNRMVEMWLISAVARALDKGTPDNPGVQVDHTLVLQSGQGKYKSTFFAVLGGAWFSDSVKDLESKDSLMIVHSNWILEIAEIDRVTSKKQAGSIKHWLTQKTDSYRKPYARELEPNLPRPCVFCATVNPSRFLVDDENRRFWIIPLAESLEAINIPLLTKERDGIWASALFAYRYGGLLPLLCLLFQSKTKASPLWTLLLLMEPKQPWWPTDEEKAAIALLNQEYKELDAWHDPIEAWIENREWVSAYEILTELFQIEPGQIKRAEDMRVSKILTNLGWTKETRKELPDETGQKRFRRVRLNPRLNKLVGKVGKDGKKITLPDSYAYRLLKKDGSESVVKSPTDVTGQKKELPTPETLAQSEIYQSSYQGQQLSYSGNGDGWKKPNGNLKPGVWIVTQNQVKAWVSQSSPLGGAWLCLSETGEEIQVSEGEIVWVWEEGNHAGTH